MKKENLKDKTVCVVDCGLFVEIAVKLSKEFKKVYYFSEWRSSFPSKKGVMIGEGLEEVTRCNDIWEIIDEVDLWVFPDVYYGGEQEYLRSIGKNVFGGGHGDELELWRDEAKEHFKELGLPVSPYKVIVGLDNLRDYLKKKKNQYVKISCYRGDFETWHHEEYKLSIPMLDKMEKSLGAMKDEYEFVIEDAIDGNDVVEAGSDLFTVDGKYPEKVITGFEIKDLGYCGVVKEYKKISPLVTDFNDKISSTLKEYTYRGFMSTEIRVGKNKIPYMLDFCARCFSSDTEVLTDSGWKLFKDCVVEDKFATLNTETKEIQYQYATNYIKYMYNGKMIELTNNKKSIECLITPNHDVLRYDRHKNKLFKEQADSLTDKGFIPRTGIWKGENIEYFELTEYHKEWNWDSPRYNGYTVCHKVKHEPAIKIKMKDWAAFLGWYLSEGSTSNQYVTQISQTKFADEVKDVLDRLPFKYNYDGAMFRISSVQLTSELNKFGLCDKKFIPDYIKQSTPEVIEEFLHYFNLGDGSRHKGNRVYYTTSKQLADDIQECIFKIGSVANIIHENRKGTIAKFKANQYIRNHDQYVLYERNNFTDFWFETQKRKSRYIKEVEYNDNVYCLTVPSGTLYVRRNGKPFWSGNCGSPPNELYQEMISNLGEIMWNAAQGIMVEPKYMAKYGIECLIHSDWASDNWQAVYFPEKIKQWVKLRNACKIGDTYYVVPQNDGLPEIGAVVAIGDSFDECVEKVKEYADQVKGYRLDIKTGSIENMKEVLDKANKLGITL